MEKWPFCWLKLGERWKLGPAEFQTGGRFETRSLQVQIRGKESQEHYAETKTLHFSMGKPLWPPPAAADDFLFKSLLDRPFLKPALGLLVPEHLRPWFKAGRSEKEGVF